MFTPLDDLSMVDVVSIVEPTLVRILKAETLHDYCIILPDSGGLFKLELSNHAGAYHITPLNTRINNTMYAVSYGQPSIEVDLESGYSATRSPSAGDLFVTGSTFSMATLQVAKHDPHPEPEPTALCELPRSSFPNKRWFTNWRFVRTVGDQLQVLWTNFDPAQ